MILTNEYKYFFSEFELDVKQTETKIKLMSAISMLTDTYQ